VLQTDEADWQQHTEDDVVRRETVLAQLIIQDH
jgi:hypothetical protein